MNSLQCIATTAGFGKADRLPVVPQILGYAAIASNVPLNDYLHNGEVQARCQIKGLEQFGHDAAFAFMDTLVEAEAAGSVLTFPGNFYPVVKTPVIPPDGTVDGLKIPDPSKDGRMPQILKSAAILRREIGSEVPVAGCVQGPMTMALALMGLENALMLAAEKPARFARVLDYAMQVCIQFGIAQIEAGVHLPVVCEPAGSPDMVPAGFFREFLAPRLKTIFTTLKGKGSFANWLHIAGPLRSILPFYTGIGVEVANIDYPVPMREARSLLPKICINGNIKPLMFVESTPEEVAWEVSRLISSLQGGGGFIISSGWELPLESKPDNIVAMIKAARQSL